ncbi:unnamed protein product [Phytophthora fragariaefolia]|uniref:Unnamed protein product n=1 Tax=Phytophthora fragariaefolia TaxID=1490495 RepID=A0A9W6Y2N0_9STRA|nr:unnamed protein product [Phytophthora fragariaefolia]
MFVTGAGALRTRDTEMTDHDLQRLIACLSTTPALQNLTLSNNMCSFPTVHKLREVIESKVLIGLRELHCAAITADDAAIGHLLEVFQANPHFCPRLKVVDMSGNSLGNRKAASQLARIFTSNSQFLSAWMELTHLNVSSNI